MKIALLVTPCKCLKANALQSERPKCFSLSFFVMCPGPSSLNSLFPAFLNYTIRVITVFSSFRHCAEINIYLKGLAQCLSLSKRPKNVNNYFAILASINYSKSNF